MASFRSTALPEEDSVQVELVVPESWVAGQTLPIDLPQGTVSADVPIGSQPGETVMVTVPKPAAQPDGTDGRGERMSREELIEAYAGSSSGAAAADAAEVFARLDDDADGEVSEQEWLAYLDATLRDKEDCEVRGGGGMGREGTQMIAHMSIYGNNH